MHSHEENRKREYNGPATNEFPVWAYKDIYIEVGSCESWLYICICFGIRILSLYILILFYKNKAHLVLGREIPRIQKMTDMYSISLRNTQVASQIKTEVNHMCKTISYTRDIFSSIHW